MTTFPAQLRDMVRRYDAAVNQALEQLACECDRSSSDRPCDRCPHAEEMTLKVREMLKKPP